MSYRSATPRSNPRYSGHAAVGRRYQAEDQPVAKAARTHDPELSRQRRIGLYIGTGTVGGAALAARGGRNIARSTRLARRGMEFVGQQGRKENLSHARRLERHGVVAMPGEAGQLFGGLGLLGGAAGLNAHAQGAANRRWR